MLSACQLLKPVNPDVQASRFLGSYRWKPIQIHGKIPPGTAAYLEFDLDRQSLHGHTGCNTITGRVDLDTDSIHFSNIRSTEKACDAPFNEVEQALYALLLSGSFRYDIAEQTLNLYRQDQLVLMLGLLKKEK